MKLKPAAKSVTERSNRVPNGWALIIPKARLPLRALGPAAPRSVRVVILLTPEQVHGSSYFVVGGVRLLVCDMGCDYCGVLDPFSRAGLSQVFLPLRR